MSTLANAIISSVHPPSGMTIEAKSVPAEALKRQRVYAALFRGSTGFFAFVVLALLVGILLSLVVVAHNYCVSNDPALSFYDSTISRFTFPQ